MAKLQLNVAGRPFVNQHPLVVATTILALVCAVFTFLNMHQLFRALARHDIVSRGIEENRGQIVATKQAASELEKELGERESRNIQRVCGSIATIIQKRRLSWSLLLDELAMAMPNDVRVLTVAPEVSGNRIRLLVSGIAKKNEAKLLFLSRLNLGPFSAAHLMGESIEKKGRIRFGMQCRYDPETAEERARRALAAPAPEEVARPRRAAAISPRVASPGAASRGAASPGAASPGAVSPSAASPSAASPSAASPSDMRLAEVRLGSERVEVER